MALSAILVQKNIFQVDPIQIKYFPSPNLQFPSKKMFNCWERRRVDVVGFSLKHRSSSGDILDCTQLIDPCSDVCDEINIPDSCARLINLSTEPSVSLSDRPKCVQHFPSFQKPSTNFRNTILVFPTFDQANNDPFHQPQTIRFRLT